MSQLGSNNNMQLKDEELVLVAPSRDMRDEVIMYKEEHFSFGDMQVHGSGGLAYYDEFDAWFEHIISISEKSGDGVKTSTFFTKRLSDGKLIGCVKIHHSLGSELESGGHIAYGIRPSERGKGYATKQLYLALQFAKQLGLHQVIVACDKDNIASARTAMSCGGILTKEFEEDGVVKQHYNFELIPVSLRRPICRIT